MSWDDDDFEVPSVRSKIIKDKWEGEDEDDDVKDSWMDEDEEKPVVVPEKKKTLKEKIAEKEKKRMEELEARRKQQEEEDALDPVEEKLRRQKLQEESDLLVAKDTFGLADSATGGKIDNFSPKTLEEFDEFSKLLCDKISTYEKSIHYSTFLETMFRNLALNMEPEEIKKLGSTLNTLCNEKTKALKSVKGKKKSKKASLNVGNSRAIDDYRDLGPEYDDFM